MKGGSPGGGQRLCVALCAARGAAGAGGEGVGEADVGAGARVRLCRTAATDVAWASRTATASASRRVPSRRWETSCGPICRSGVEEPGEVVAVEVDAALGQGEGVVHAEQGGEHAGWLVLCVCFEVGERCAV